MQKPYYSTLCVNDVILIINCVTLNCSGCSNFNFLKQIEIMKNFLYVIAGLLVVIWAIVFLSFDSSQAVHYLLVVAGLIILIRLIFYKQLSGTTKNP